MPWRRARGCPLQETLDQHFPWCAEWADELTRLYRAYVERKLANQALDYDDLLLYWHAMMQDVDLAAEIGGQFEDDLQFSLRANFEFAVVAVIQQLDHISLMWQLRRIAQAIAYELKLWLACGITTVFGMNNGSSDVFELKRLYTDKPDMARFVLTVSGVMGWLDGAQRMVASAGNGR